MKGIVIAALLLQAIVASAQNTLTVTVKSEKTKEPLIGVIIRLPALKKGGVTNDAGMAEVTGIPNGTYIVTISSTGYEELERKYTFPIKDLGKISIELEPATSELSEIVVQTTRSSRTIKDLPTRIEAITGEELDEKITMEQGDIKMLLNESTGIATQQTSAISGTANIRIQGLDGRYTQLLRDGMPLYSGFSGGLSIMQIAPLDLKQVELIKGSASTLYGGGAIAGLVNLISKTPEKEKEFTILLNGTSAKGFDASTFFSKRFNKIGTTIFASYNYNAPYDPSGIGFTAIPKTQRVTINPKLFFYLNKKTSGFIGFNTTYENRYGGDMKVLENRVDSTHQYYEKNLTLRTSSQLNIEHKISDNSGLQFKNSIGFFNRELSVPGYRFAGQQFSSFTELNYHTRTKKMEWVTGLNLWTDHFSNPNDSVRLDYNQTTLGAFVQNTFAVTSWLSLESGLRMDYNIPATNDKMKGIFILPRINGLIKINNHWTSRIGGGLGYKMPSLFNEEAEEKGYRQIAPIHFDSLKAEQSIGGNADINYRTYIGQLTFSINQLFFYTYLDNPLILQGSHFMNANGDIHTQGAETNLKLGYKDLKLYVGYTYTNARQHFNNIDSWRPLVAKHRLNAVLSYEIEHTIRIGLEGLYVSEQMLSDGTIGRGYVMFGFLVEKMWEHMNVFINAENFTDRRQTRWESIYSGSTANPVYRDIYAPLDGVVINAGVKIKL